MKDHFKGNPRASRLCSASGEGGEPKHVMQPALHVLMRVLRRYGLYCAHQAACYGRREPETRLRGGWCHVDKGAVGDGLRAGVAEDDLSEKALGAVCF